MTRSRAMTWIGCATLALIVTGQRASSQALKPDAHGFLIAAPEDIKAPNGGRSVLRWSIGNARKEIKRASP